MLDMGWVNITLNGTDLEPVPDYFPMFIYRRSLQINLTYENLYYDRINEKYIDILEHPEDYHSDEEQNGLDKEDNMVIPAKYLWIIKQHFYNEKTGKVYLTKEYEKFFLKKLKEE